MVAIRVMRRFNIVLARVATTFAAALGAVMVAAITWQVFTRLAFNRSPPWTEEVALLAFAWITMLMVAIGVRENLHVRVDPIPSGAPALLRLANERAVALLVTSIGGYLVWSGISYVREAGGSVSAAIRYPSELLYISMPVSGALLFLFAIERVFVRAASVRRDPS